MKKHHILIVEDEQNLLATLDFILETANYRVTAVEDGQKALQTILDCRKKNIPVDVLVTDIRMPQMSGLELLKRLEALGIILPTLVITNHGSSQLRKSLAHWDCLYCLEKPLDDEEVLHHIKLLLGESG